MAVGYCDAGSFTSRSTAGIDTISVGFAPKGVIINVAKAPFSDTSAANADIQNVIALSDGTTTRSCSIFDTNAASTTDSRYGFGTTLLAVTAAGGTLLNGAISFSGNNININWSTISGAWSVSWWAVGGADINAQVGFWNKAGIGSTAFTGLTFQPKAMFMLSSRSLNSATVSSTNVQRMTVVIDDDADEHGLGYTAGDAVTPSDSSRVQSTAQAFTIRPANNGSVQAASTVTSLNANGFTMNFSSVSSSSFHFTALAIGGTGLLAAENVTLVANTTSGANTQTFSGLPFQPDGGIVMSMSDTSNNTNGVGARGQLGMFSAALNQSSMINNSPDAQAVTSVWEGMSSSAALVAHDTNAAPYSAHGRVASVGPTSMDVVWGAGKTTSAYAWSALLFNLDTPVPTTGVLASSLGGATATMAGGSVATPPSELGARILACVT